MNVILKCPFHKKVKKEHKVEVKFIALSVCVHSQIILNIGLM